ncbi:ATP-dependent 3'-5' DNA helicase [Blastocladiella emersonii ATCC 22665]|nr:ATP-dependent 3'-5' DNA helicase [Blastocladiella emersonii ATCC 22665]
MERAKRPHSVQQQHDGEQIEAPPAAAARAGFKIRRTAKKPRTRAASAAASAQPAPPSSTAPTATPLPDYLASLVPVFAAINTTATFMAARGVHLTLDQLKSAVDGATGGQPRPFDVTVLRELLAVAPNLVAAGWADELGRGSQAAKLDDLAASPLRTVQAAQQSVTVALVGVPLTSEAGPAKKKVSAANALKAMTRGIEARNAAFRAALDAFHAACIAESKDPAESLAELASTTLPDVPALDRPRPLRLTDTAGAASTPAARDVEANSETSDSAIDILTLVTRERFYYNQLVATHTVPARAARFGTFPPRLSAGLRTALERYKGIRELYAHQADGIDRVLDGAHVIVTTSTSSGKSLVYTVPMLHALEHDRRTRCLYLCPTKALAQDQLRGMRSLLNACAGHLEGVEVAAFDGDTPQADRAGIRAKSQILLSNPDMLHVTILPNAHEWAAWLARLKYVVVDEAHEYHGVFGSHCAWIFRRLRRLAAHYGNTSLQFIACSATIANPVEHARALFGLEFEHIGDDASPAGRRLMAIWNPPLVTQPTVPRSDPDAPAPPAAPRRVPRVSSVAETARLFVYLVARGVRTVAFTKYRQACELLFKEVSVLLAGDAALLDRVRSYRGGYHPEERRVIERGLAAGEFWGVVATNALELGIDIGGLDAKQQAGRAGRRARDSVSVLIPEAHPLDQFFARHPDKVFSPDTEQHTVVDPSNEGIAAAHLACAAFELPVHAAEPCFGGIEYADLVPRHLVRHEAQDVYESPVSFPARTVAIRSIQNDQFTVVDRTRPDRHTVLEYLEASRAAFALYIGGIFLNQGTSYLLTDVNPATLVAGVRATAANYYTSCQDITNIDPVRDVAAKRLGPVEVRFAEVQVTTQVFGYHKIDTSTRRILETVELTTPAMVRPTRAMYMDVPAAAVRSMGGPDLAYAAIHALNHALLNLLPVAAVLGSTNEAGCECRGTDNRRPRPFRVLVYDKRTGGVGLARRLFETCAPMLRNAVRLVGECLCDDGCPECVLWKHCSQQNELINKRLAVVLARYLLDA